MWVKIVIKIFLLVFMVNAYAQDIVIPLWNKQSPPNYQECGEKYVLNIEHNYHRLVVNPNISMFFPSDTVKKSNKVVLIIPGGGYWGIAYESEGNSIAKILIKKGFIAAVLKYRLPHNKSNHIRYKSPLLDVERAIRILKNNAKKWGVSKFGVMGFSAGGHLASTLGVHFDEENNYKTDAIDSISSRPDFMVLIYPVITMDSTFTHKGSRDNFLGKKPSKDLINYFSNEKQVTPNTPPTFIVSSSVDKVVPIKNSLVFYEALIQNHVKAELHVFEYGEHGFSLAKGKGRLEIWMKLCVDWIRNN